MPDDNELVVRLLQEEASLTKEIVETGRVTVTRSTREHSEEIAEPLTTEIVEISRVPIGRQIESVPAVREDGDTIVIPVVEERLQIERQLILKEEVRVRRVRTSRTHAAHVPLRHHVVTVTRHPATGVRQQEETGDTATSVPIPSGSHHHQENENEIPDNRSGI